MIPLAALAMCESLDMSVQKHADILMLYYISQTSSGREAWDMAKEAIEMDPSNIYAYAAAASQISSSKVPSGETIEIARRGIEIARTLHVTDTYLFRKLLLTVIKTSFFTSMIDLLRARPENHGARESAESALKDVLSMTEEYLKVTPPDALDLPCVLDTRMAAIIYKQGSELSFDLKELRVRCLALYSRYCKSMLK